MVCNNQYKDVTNLFVKPEKNSTRIYLLTYNVTRQLHYYSTSELDFEFNDKYKLCKKCIKRLNILLD